MSAMKVLIINKSKVSGGAAVAANRLFEALKTNGTDVKMLVEDAVDETDDVQCIANTTAKKKKAFRRFVLERLFFFPREKSKAVRFMFSPAKVGVDISQHPWVQEADIIHLHWINHGFLSLKGLKKLFTLNKPIVWTLHDMWAFTGGCHYAGACENFVTGCGNCPFIKLSGKRDFSSRLNRRKQKIWDNTLINTVGCSNWMRNLAQKSSLLTAHNNTSIPNPIDTNIFTSLDKNKCREEFGLPLNKKLILFGAANVNDPRKGFKELVHALAFLDVRFPDLIKELELVVFGKCKKQEMNKLPYKWHKVNFISDTNKIAKLYNCADAFVLPSLEDNLPNTVMESLACGVPVVAFNIGGVPEMINHKETGYLAIEKNSDDLAKGIHHVLYENNTAYMQSSAKYFVADNYGTRIVAQQYNKLYTSLLSK